MGPASVQNGCRNTTYETVPYMGLKTAAYWAEDSKRGSQNAEELRTTGTFR